MLGGRACLAVGRRRGTAAGCFGWAACWRRARGPEQWQLSPSPSRPHHTLPHQSPHTIAPRRSAGQEHAGGVHPPRRGRGPACAAAAVGGGRVPAAGRRRRGAPGRRVRAPAARQVGAAAARLHRAARHGVRAAAGQQPGGGGGGQGAGLHGRGAWKRQAGGLEAVAGWAAGEEGDRSPQRTPEFTRPYQRASRRPAHCTSRRTAPPSSPPSRTSSGASCAWCAPRAAPPPCPSPVAPQRVSQVQGG